MWNHVSVGGSRDRIIQRAKATARVIAFLAAFEKLAEQTRTCRREVTDPDDTAFGNRVDEDPLVRRQPGGTGAVSRVPNLQDLRRGIGRWRQAGSAVLETLDESIDGWRGDWTSSQQELGATHHA